MSSLKKKKLITDQLLLKNQIQSHVDAVSILRLHLFILTQLETTKSPSTLISVFA